MLLYERFREIINEINPSIPEVVTRGFYDNFSGYFTEGQAKRTGLLLKLLIKETRGDLGKNIENSKEFEEYINALTEN